MDATLAKRLKGAKIYNKSVILRRIYHYGRYKKKKIEHGYDDNGAYFKLEIHIPYNEFKSFKLPENCMKCPCGYGIRHCGRNVPFENEDKIKRSISCKLKQFTEEEILGMIYGFCDN